MKRWIIKKALLSLCLALCANGVVEARSECDKLWKRYDEASARDLPRTQMSILSEIKSLAATKRLDTDFFQASKLYFETGCSINWKVRDSLLHAWGEEVKAYNEAELTCLWMRETGLDAASRYDYIHLNGTRLQESSHKDLWKKYSAGIYSEFSKNDYEFELWSLYDCYAKEDSVYLKELSSYERGSYPLDAYLEFRQCPSSKYLVFIEKYKGRAISMFAKRALLDMEFEELAQRHSSSDSDYKILYEKCMEYKRQCASFRGEEKRICATIDSVDAIIAILKGQSIRLYADSSLVSIYLSNVPKVELSLLSSDGKSTLLKKELDNPKRSFYVVDTLTMRLPDLEDGEYLLQAKYRDVKDLQQYSSYRLSVAFRPSDEGLRFYIAEYDTGKPLEKVDVILKNADGVLAKSDSVFLDGFTSLPKDILDALAKPQKYELFFKTADEKGHIMLGRVPYYGFYWKGNGSLVSAPKRSVRAEIFTDRSAYNPGDTLYFKSVLFYDGADLVSLSKGEKCRASLVDSDGDEICFKELYTNEYGSIAGGFPVDKVQKNGRFYIRISYDGSAFTKRLRLDDFSLPSYELTFDDIKQVYLPGDIVRITGALKSYDGHQVELAKASYQLSSEKQSHDLEVSEDGTFAIVLGTEKTRPYQYYSLNVRIVEKSGEVREFRKFFDVSEHVSVIGLLKNSEQGVFSANDYEQSSILLEDKALFDFHINTCDGIVASLPIGYSVSDEGGMEVKSGRVISGQELEVDMSGLSSGVYKVSAWAYSDTTSFNVLKLNAGDRSFHSHVMWAVAKDSDKSGFYLGCGDGKCLYTVVEVYEQNTNTLIDKFKLDVKENSLEFYDLDYGTDVMVNVFAFKGGKKLDYSMTFSCPERSFDLPLEFSFFEDRTLPNTEYKFVIKTLPSVECLVAVFDKSVDYIAKNDWWPIRKKFQRDFITLSWEGNVGITMPFIRYMMKSADSAIMEENANGKEVPIREKFEKTLTFQPFLHSDRDGYIDFSFRTSGKLSTYYVSLFAHDPKVRNAVLRKEMVVTIPVRLALSEPKYLYVEDRCEVPISISSIYDRDIEGKLACYIDGHLVKEEKVLIPSLGSSTSHLRVEAKKSGPMDVKVVFSSTNSYTDAIRVSIPVYPASQVITESYSMVLSRPEQQEQAERMLLERFVNTPTDSVIILKRRVYDMLDELCSSNVSSQGSDVISLCGAL